MAVLLSDVLRRNRALTPGQVVTVGVAIARELAALHSRGQVHAAITADAIEIEPDGRPTLGPGAGGDGTPIDDLRDLVAVLRASAGPRAGLSLLRVLGNPTDATAFATELYAVCAPEPLAFTAPRPAGRSRLGRARVAGVVAAAAVVAAFAGVASARAGHGTTAVVPHIAASPTGRGPSPRPQERSTDWRAVIARLDGLRNRAFAAGEESMLRAVYVVGSAAWQADLRSLREMVAHHARANGLAFVVEDVHPLATNADQVALRVTDERPAYTVVDAAGHVIARRPARATRAWRIVLDRVDGSWRIASIV